MRLGALLLIVVAAACSSTAAPGTATTQTSYDPSTTSTSSTTSTAIAIEPIETTALRLLEPGTLRATKESVEIPGWPWEEPVALPDGRFLFVSSLSPEPDRLMLTSVDFATGVATSTELDYSETRILGYSAALERVVMLRDSGRGSRIALIDPDELTIVEQAPFQDETDGWWPYQWALFDEGRRIAFYTTSGYAEDHVYEPPQVRILDFENNVLGDPIDVEGVIHGLTELPDEFVRYPDFPYGEAKPGITFDSVDGRLFVAHADGTGLTHVDLVSGEVQMVSWDRQPSFWGRALSWLIPPAQAKGSEPSATVSAWLSPDRSLLYVTGEANDAWRDAEGRLHTTTEPLGLMAVNTATLQVVRTIDLPVSRGLSSDSGLGMAGDSGRQIWCDEVCKPGNNEPEVEGEADASGLYVLDPSSLEIVMHVRPGVSFWYLHSYQDWLVTESETPGGWGYESIDTRTGEISPLKSAAGTHSLMVTEGGILEVDWPGS